MALGNTASVMPSLAREVGGLYVAFPTNVSSPVLQVNDRCFPTSELNFPLSVSCYRFVARTANSCALFHSELGYAPACLMAGVRYGVHLHGVTDVDLLFPKTPMGKLLKARYREALANASYVVCHPAVLAKARQLRPDAQALRLPIDTAQFNPSVEPHRFEGSFPIFSPTRMDQWKGHETMWQALASMRHRDEVTVYQSDWGWEPQYTTLRREAPPNVRFIPVVPREKIASFYAGASLVLGQMKIGDFGMAELEAAATGTPTLVYLKDARAPFLPKFNDPKTLAGVLDEMVEDGELRSSYSRACRDYVLETSSLRSVSRELSAIFKKAHESERPKMIGRSGLFLGSGFEIAGRSMGEKRFGLLKAALIGL